MSSDVASLGGSEYESTDGTNYLTAKTTCLLLRKQVASSRA